jgi:hypothetical protein
VWITPHTLVASLAEARRMGGAHHPLLGVFGVMSAKNTAVNIVILTTFLSFVLYRRANKKRVLPREAGGTLGPAFVAALAFFPVAFCGVNGFASNAARAERMIPVLDNEVRQTTDALLASTATVGEHLEEIRLLGVKQAQLEDLKNTAGIHQVAGFRVLSLLFAALMALAVSDMFLFRGRFGELLQMFILVVAAGIVVYYGVLGYFVDAEVRIGFSVYQVMAVLFAMAAVTAIDLFIFFGARSLGKVEWGKMPERSQYVLVLLAVVFTLTIALMGIVRSGIRGSWHVYGVVRDTSAQSFTPTMAYGSIVASAATATFLGMVSLIFWLGMRTDETQTKEPAGVEPTTQQPA